jgi:hypothetical protein
MNQLWDVTEVGVTASSVAGTGTIQFRASNLRVERGHRYATVTVVYEGRVLDEDDIRLSKREERQRLMNSAHKIMLPMECDYPLATAQSEMLEFCQQVWEHYLSKSTYVETYGSEPTPVPWILAPFAIEDAGTIMFAPPGSGKSWTALGIAIAVDAGGSDLWMPSKQVNTLYVNLERSQGSFERRIGSLNEALGHDRARPVKMIHGRGQSLIDIADMTRRVIDKHDVGLVILDSLSRAGQSLVDDTAANKTMDVLNSLGCAWLAIGHTPRNDATHVFGSQMFTAAADLEVGIEWKEDMPFMYQRMTMVKSNDAGKLNPVSIRYEMDEFGVQAIKYIPDSMFPEDDDTYNDVEEEEPVRELTSADLAWIKSRPEGITVADFAIHHQKSVAWANRRLEASQYLKKEVGATSVSYSLSDPEG